MRAVCKTGLRKVRCSKTTYVPLTAVFRLQCTRLQLAKWTTHIHQEIMFRVLADAARRHQRSRPLRETTPSVYVTMFHHNSNDDVEWNRTIQYSKYPPLLPEENPSRHLLFIWPLEAPRRRLAYVGISWRSDISEELRLLSRSPRESRASHREGCLTRSTGVQ
jgi:hypothetical protein